MLTIDRGPAYFGLLAGLMAALSAWSAHWFITGGSEATAGRQALVALQLVACAALAWWAYRRARRLETELEGTGPGPDRG